MNTVINIVIILAFAYALLCAVGLIFVIKTPCTIINEKKWMQAAGQATLKMIIGIAIAVACIVGRMMS